MTYKEFRSLKPGDKIKCINNISSSSSLKLNKNYIVKYITPPFENPRIKILGDEFRTYSFKIERFSKIKKQNIG